MRARQGRGAASLGAYTETAIYYFDLAFALQFGTLLPWLWATARLGAHPVRWWRLTGVTIVGSVVAVVWDYHDWWSPPLALLGTLLLLQAAFGPLRVGALIRTLIPFVLIGATAVGFTVLSYGSVVAPSQVILVGIALGAGGLQLAWREMAVRAANSAHRWRVRFDLGERSLSLDGLVDTGHQLRAPLTGLPVLLVAPGDLVPLLGKSLCELLSGSMAEWDQLPEPWRGTVRAIPFQTVAGEGLLPAIRPDGVWLQRGSDPWRRVEALVGIAAFGVGGRGDYQVLLPPIFMESLR